jgi:hypothetical protein
MKLTQDAVTHLKAAAAAGDPETDYSNLSENRHSYGLLGGAAATIAFMGRVTMLFITHRLPAPLAVDQAVRLKVVQ